MSQTEDAEDCEVQVENENIGDPVKKEDEQLIEGIVFSAVVSNTPELADPAILAVREMNKFRYSKDELMNLRDVPLSKKKPEFINPDVAPPSIWDPEHWNERKKSTTPTDSTSRVDQQQADNRRRPGDPRERLRKENDGIVLSPQRRSFNSGCFVPMREQPQGRGGGPRPHSPIGGGNKGDNPHMNIREIQTGGNRRIGSGRILRDSWDFNEKTEGGENDYYRGGSEDRRSFRRDFDLPNKDRRNNGGRYGNRRISGGEKDEEPEWFSGGPMSQNDTIELRGFDEPEKAGMNNKKKPPSSQAKRVREWAKKKNGTFDEKLEDEQCDNGPKPPNQADVKSGTVTPTPQDGGAGKVVASVPVDKDTQANDNDKENRHVATNNINSTGNMENINEHSFLFDDIFKCDSIPGLLTNGVEGTAENNTKSRFSRWFKHESPEKAPDSRRSSLQEEHILKNLLNDINEPATVNIPPQLGNSESYFVPISPAAVNSGGGEPGAPRPGQVNIAEMFQRGKREQTAGVKNGPQADVLNNMKTRKVMSLNELESRMRKSADISGNHGHPNPQIKKEDDMSAFKRLMLSHSQKQEEVQVRLNQQCHLVGGPGSPKTPSMGPLHNEFLLKMQQAQQEQQAQLQRQQQVNMLNKLMGLHSAASAPHLRASPLQDLAQQQSKELLSRPEAQAILQGLKRGDITPQHLYQQLANPALQARHREMLYAILKMQRVGPSPRVLSPVPPPLQMFPQQQQQQLRVSPLPNGSKDSKNMETNKFPQGRAVIGARIQQQQPQPINQWNNQYIAKQPGRPIVKANSTYQNTGPDQFFSAHQQQQFLFNQQQSRQQQGGQHTPIAASQQQVAGSGQYGQQQKQSQQNTGVNLGNIGQYSNQSNQHPQQFPQLTQQQLRAQHQQQARPTTGGSQPVPPQPQSQQKPPNFPHQQQIQQNTAWQQFLNAAAQQSNRAHGGRGAVGDGDLSPTTSNQLARWFSSDLLERARGGELPSTAGLAQHSLEEIERQAAPPVHN